MLLPCRYLVFGSIDGFETHRKIRRDQHGDSAAADGLEFDESGSAPQRVDDPALQRGNILTCGQDKSLPVDVDLVNLHDNLGFAGWWLHIRVASRVRG